jgi:hypothetical protein
VYSIGILLLYSISRAAWAHFVDINRVLPLPLNYGYVYRWCGRLIHVVAGNGIVVSYIRYLSTISEVGHVPFNSATLQKLVNRTKIVLLSHF